jgi:NAD kinase
VLNECLIDRGASPNMVTLEAYVDGHHITTVQVCSSIFALKSGYIRQSVKLHVDGHHITNVQVCVTSCLIVKTVKPMWMATISPLSRYVSQFSLN